MSYVEKYSNFFGVSLYSEYRLKTTLCRHSSVAIGCIACCTCDAVPATKSRLRLCVSSECERVLQCTEETGRRRVASGRISQSASNLGASSPSASSKSASGSGGGRRLFSKRSTATRSRSRRAELTINARPFSASHSPYEERLAHTAPPAAAPHRAKNSRKANSVQ